MKVKYVGSLGGIKIALRDGIIKVKRGEILEMNAKEWDRYNATGNFELVKEIKKVGKEIKKIERRKR